MKTKLIFITYVFLFLGFGAHAQTFQDNFARENDGDFPSKWDLIKGSAEVFTLNGYKAVRLENKSIITPNIGSTDYLSDIFTLQFEAYFDEAPKSLKSTYYGVRFWSGTTITPTYNNENGKGSYSVLKVFRHGTTMSAKDEINGSTKHNIFKPELEDSNAVSRKVTIEYNQGALRVFIDNVSILQIPNYKLIPSMISVEGYAMEGYTPLISAIKKISLSYNTSSGNNIDPLLVDIDSPVDLDSPVDENIDAIATDPDLPDTTVDPKTFANTGLEAINEGNGIGWRLIGRDPENYSNIGFNAVDLSYNDTSSGGASGQFSFAVGNKTSATKMGSTAIGIESKASGNYSVSIGLMTKATEYASIAIGNGTEASGITSTAIGLSTKASGNASTAMGSETQALGDYSTALGYQTEAIGKNSTAMGEGTKALGWYSTAFGYNTKAESNNVFVIGRYNIGGGDRSLWGALSPLFEIGNGDTDNASNALTVLNLGHIGIGTHLPETKLHITNGGDAKLSKGGFDNGYVVIGETSKSNLVFDNNEIMARDNGQTTTLYLQHEGGDVQVGGSVVHSSDRRLKKGISELPYGLNEILQLTPKSYFWRDREETHKSLGLIAQEVQPIIKEIVHVGEDKNNTLSLNYTGLIPVLIKALQEQQDIIDDQNSELKELKAEFKTINQRIKLLEASHKTSQ